MRIASIALIAILFGAGLVAADEPPAWAPFELRSANGRYLAAVRHDPGQVHEEVRLPGWRLTVYLLKGDQRKKLWTCRYAYDGYTEGLLSDDGRTFVYVNRWYRHDKAMVSIYRDGRRVRTIAGHDIDFDRNSMIRTVSHRLWLDPQKGPQLQGPDQLILHLTDGRSLVVPLDAPKHRSAPVRRLNGL